MRENLIKTKTYSFSIKIVKIYKKLVEFDKEFCLSKQLVNAGTSIGANVEEANGAQSRKDFISKMSIAYKEARETGYWLRILKDSDYLDAVIAENLLGEVESICRILGKIIGTTKKRL